jgi:hypothetical protein
MAAAYAADDRANFALAITAAAAALAGLPVLAGATVVAAIFFGLVSAWVLLVEILR